MIRKSLVVLVLLCLSFSMIGCASVGIKPGDPPVVKAQKALDVATAIWTDAQVIWTIPADKVAKVNAAIKTAQDAIDLWKQTGTDPGNFEALLADVFKLIADAKSVGVLKAQPAAAKK